MHLGKSCLWCLNTFIILLLSRASPLQQLGVPTPNQSRGWRTEADIWDGPTRCSGELTSFFCLKRDGKCHITTLTNILQSSSRQLITCIRPEPYLETKDARQMLYIINKLHVPLPLKPSEQLHQFTISTTQRPKQTFLLHCGWRSPRQAVRIWSSATYESWMSEGYSVLPDRHSKCS